MKNGFHYIVGVYINDTGKKVDTTTYQRTSKTCGDEVLETANAFYTGDNTCRIDGIGILNEIGQIVGFVDEKEVA